MRHLKWSDWLFIGYMAAVSLGCWVMVWVYFYVVPRGWPLGLVALFASLLVSGCTAGIVKLMVDKANWDAEYALEKEKLDKEREKLYG